MKPDPSRGQRNLHQIRAGTGHSRWTPLLAFFLGILTQSTAAERAAPGLGTVTNIELRDSGLVLEIGKDDLTLNFCQPDLLRVHFRPARKESPATPSIARTRWPSVHVETKIDAELITLVSDRMLVRITRSPCRISVYDRGEKLLIREGDSRGVFPGGIDFATAAGSRFYGLKGWEYLDDSKGRMELSPQREPYYIKAGGEGNTGGPLLWSNLGYGVFIDTDRGYCQVRSDTELHFTEISRPDVEYYVMEGGAARIQSSVSALTGHPPMFPKWSLGFSNSEFADMNETLAMSNVDGYRKRGIPFDLYVFDFQWKAWGEDHFGELRWNPKNFPNGPSGEFARRMAEKGVKLGGIMKPRIHVESEQGRYAAAHGFWVKDRAPYEDYFSKASVNDLDFAQAACRQWFWDNTKPTFDSGLVAFWNDEADAWGDTWENMFMQQALYEGQRVHTQDRQRVWSINRNFYSGAQRYAYATWSGDIESGFKVMQQQRERLLCSVNVGQARWGMDTGGFNNHENITGEEYAESFARWMEFAAFVPVFRTHGCTYHQPWLFGDKAESAAKKAIRLRYSLLPYLYACERQLNRSGVGLVRPLVWDYPGDPACADRVDAWMFGDYLLAAPIVERGQKTKEIALPKGDWIDYFRGVRYRGGKTITYSVTHDSWDDVPLFIKEGAIIPSIDVLNYVGEKPVERVYVDVFPSDRATQFEYYDDDGVSYDYERGLYFSQSITVQAKEKATELRLSAPAGSFTPELRFYLFRVHTDTNSRVVLNGKDLPRAATLELLDRESAEGWANGTDVYGAVTLIKIRAGQARHIVLLKKTADENHN
jgi:alpha-glucosidase